MEMVFTINTLQGQWSCDTMNRRCKSMYDKNYAEIFANKAYFAKIYPMGSRSKAGESLKLFCKELGVPEKLNFDGYKKELCKRTNFMIGFIREDIDYYISEHDLYNHNPVEGVIT